MKLKFLLWAAMSLTFTGVFMSCEDEDVKEEEEKKQVKEEEEKEDEEADEKDEGEEVEDSEEMADILEFAPISESTVKVIGIKDKFRTEITIPATIQVYGKEYKVTSFNDDAFEESNVKSVKLAEGFTEIPDSMFYSCESLPSIEIPSSVTSIGDAAFSGCESLPSIEIPSSVTSIGEWAFAGCWELKSIEIPSSVTSIGERAFAGCSGLPSIEVSTNNPNYTSINGVLFDKDIKTLISCPVGFSGKFSIPSSVTSIGEWAFEDCYDSDIVIDNSEENVTVENGALNHCKSVTWKR